MPEESYDDIVTAIQGHRVEIMKAQQAVLKKEIDMPTYNRVYKEHLDAIHALEARIHAMQGGG